MSDKDDLISRQMAIEALDELFKKVVHPSNMSAYAYDSAYAQEEIDAYVTAIDTVKTLPAVQPEPHWIPCSERLPEEDTEVLISYRYKEGEGDTDHVNIDITSYGTTCFGGREIHTLKEWRQPFDYFHANYEVIAWMPLPEPYKGGGE